MDLLSSSLQSLSNGRLKRAWEQAWGRHRRVVRASHTPKRRTSRKSAMVSRLLAKPSIQVKIYAPPGGERVGVTPV